MSAREAIATRRSQSKVTDAAPTHEEILALVAAAGRVADHSSLRPWRLIELRGDARARLGAAIAEAENKDEPSTKPMRAPLLIAVVASRRESEKVPAWEQDAVASGVAHMLSLLLDEAGWTARDAEGYRSRDGRRLAATLLMIDSPALPANVAVAMQADAKKIGIDGRSRMNKQQLEEAIRNHR